jgi:hypothetical protein
MKKLGDMQDEDDRNLIHCAIYSHNQTVLRYRAFRIIKYLLFRDLTAFLKTNPGLLRFEGYSSVGAGLS